MTVHDELITFAVARLGEAEAVAHNSGPARVAWLTYRNDAGRMLYTTVAAGDDYGTSWVADGHELPEPASAEVVYDPARVLREVAAKRAIVAHCLPLVSEPDQWPNGLVSLRAALARQVMTSLASAWDDHPGYREEWKP
jgi:hypothetical protein